MTLRICFAVTCWLAALVSSPAADAAHLSGKVELGGSEHTSPQGDVTVTLYEATEGKPRILGRSTTDRVGRFTINSPKGQSQSIFFVTAELGVGLTFVTILGPDLPAKATINELTTVAASYSMAQFYRKGYISGNAFGLRVAAGMNANIVSPKTGKSSPVLMSSPNADETHSLRMTRSLSNLLAACVDRPLVRLLFFLLTTPRGGSMPWSTDVALANLARDPGRPFEVTCLYLLSKLQHGYRPALVRPPDAWTVTVKVNDSGDDNQLFGGPANLAFDSRGYAWITNNVVQRTPNSSKYLMVLQPNGKPAIGGRGLPTSPVTGGGILGVAWGVTVDRFDNVWVGNFGWGSQDNWPTAEAPGNGSVSVVSPDGTPLSGAEGFFGGTYRVQAIETDGRGNVWMASFGNDRVVCFPGGDPKRAIYYQLHEHAAPFGLAIDEVDGAVWVTNSGGLTGRFGSSVAKFVLQDGEIKKRFETPIGDTLKVIAVDSRGNAWFTSQGSDSIYAMRPDGRLLGRFGSYQYGRITVGTGGVDGPWGLTIDGEDNVWVANFGQTAPGVFRSGGISKFAGVNPATRPPGTRMGEALSPSTGYTVHSAGRPVRLHDGTLLLDRSGPGNFVPYQRQTSLKIDQAGNVWTINNYKSRWVTDVVGYDSGELSPADADPGGDGIIIYVGLAPPRKPVWKP